MLTPFTDRVRLGLKWLGACLALLLVLAIPAGHWALYDVLPYSILYISRSERWDAYHNATPSDYGLKAADIWVEAEPGLWLRGWYVAAGQTPARGTIVLLHGHSSCKEAMLGLAQVFSGHGYNCLLYDSRAHGESGGRYCTFGYYERHDFSRVVDVAEQRFGPLGTLAVFGSSMGGAVALQTMPLEPRIRCGVVASAFANLREVTREYMQHDSGVPFFFISNIPLGQAARIAHFVTDDVNPEAAAREIRQPVFLAHGTDDEWIAFRNGEQIARSLKSPGSVWYPVPGADHDGLWRKGGARYQQAVLDFLDLHCR